MKKYYDIITKILELYTFGNCGKFFQHAIKIQIIGTLYVANIPFWEDIEQNQTLQEKYDVINKKQKPYMN